MFRLLRRVHIHRGLRRIFFSFFPFFKPQHVEGKKKNWYFYAALQFHNRDYPRRNNFLESKRSGRKGSCCTPKGAALKTCVYFMVSSLLSCMLSHKPFSSLKGWIKSECDCKLINCNRLATTSSDRVPQTIQIHTYFAPTTVSEGAVATPPISGVPTNANIGDGCHHVLMC